MLQALKARIQAMKETRAKARMQAILDLERKHLEAKLAIAKAKIEREAALAKARITYEVWKD